MSVSHLNCLDNPVYLAPYFVQDILLLFGAYHCAKP
jgi:hypothetical protein